MKNKFIRKWLVILTVAAMMIPAGIPANAETVEEGENIAPTAGISAETPNVTAETQKEEISAEMPDMTAETQNEEKSDVQAEGQNQAKQGVLEAVRQNTEKAEEASDAVDVQAEERTAGEVQIGEQIYPTLTEAFAAAKDGDVLRLLENAEVSQPILLTKIQMDLLYRRQQDSKAILCLRIGEHSILSEAERLTAVWERTR